MVLFKEALSQWSPNRRINQENAENGILLYHDLGDTSASPKLMFPEEILSQPFVENAVRLIVTRFLPLKGQDLEVWENDPEQWINSDERDEEAWEFEIRVCFLFLPPASPTDRLLALCRACTHDNGFPIS